MGLTSGLFITLMMVMAVGSLATAVWLWPRVAGRRPRDLGARIGMLVVCQVLVIAAFLVFINGYFSFFGSWAEVFGSNAPPPIRLAGVGAGTMPIQITASDLGPAPGSGSVLPVQADGVIASRPPGAPAYSRGPHQAGNPPLPGLSVPSGLTVPGEMIAAGQPTVPGGEAVPLALPGQVTVGTTVRPAGRRSSAPPMPTQGPGRVRVTPAGQPFAPAVSGEVLQVSIRGERTGIAVSRDYVYLPPQYFQRAYARARFPVVLALTGYPNDTWSIIKWLALPATAARLVAAKRIKPAIYLMMNVSPALPRDTECTNVPAGLQVFSFFGTDVPRAMEQTFRVQTGRTGWATLGYSTGAYCAVKLAMMASGQYASAVSLAGYFNAIQDQSTGDLYGGSAAYRNDNNLDWRLMHLPAPPVSVLATTSRSGELSYPGTLYFLRNVHPPMHGYSLILPQGGHNYRTWDRELPQSLEWLSKRLAPAAPQRPDLDVQRS
jgi:enterochelin esterase-like enzyme